MKKRFIGIDLHKKSFTAAIRDEDGKTRIITFEFCPEGINKFKEMLTKSDYAAIEASSSTFYLYDQIKDSVKKCIVVNPKKFKVISESSSKTDKRMQSY